MTTAIALFTRDLRVHDNPVLGGAARADDVVPLFVLDEAILAGSFNRPNRAAFLLDCLTDLDRALNRIGGSLIVRRGDPAVEVARLAARLSATSVHVARDVSAYAHSRERRIRRRLAETGCELRVHDAVVTAQSPGELVPASRDHYAVFTPYFRKWSERALRETENTPEGLRVPAVDTEALPERETLCRGELSPELLTGGESAARRRLDDWLDGKVADYVGGQDDMAADATSGLSPYLHFGCLSPVEIVRRAGPSDAERAFVRQMAWRDFHHQVLAARQASSWHDYRTHHDRWRGDPEALRAWRDGRTGIPIVDAGMRQLARHGWMHNRARLITGSFLTKTLYVDWRIGAQHFLDLLVDGDIANNNMNWQWVAGTGTDTRPNRVLNPVRQARRYDPDGNYVRRFVPELADLAVRDVHEPWRLGEEELERRGYPVPIVDTAEAQRYFLDARGKL